MTTSGFKCCANSSSKDRVNGNGNSNAGVRHIGCWDVLARSEQVQETSAAVAGKAHERGSHAPRGGPPAQMSTAPALYGNGNGQSMRNIAEPTARPRPTAPQKQPEISQSKGKTTAKSQPKSAVKRKMDEDAAGKSGKKAKVNPVPRKKPIRSPTIASHGQTSVGKATQKPAQNQQARSAKRANPAQTPAPKPAWKPAGLRNHCEASFANAVVQAFASIPELADHWKIQAASTVPKLNKFASDNCYHLESSGTQTKETLLKRHQLRQLLKKHTKEM